MSLKRPFVPKSDVKQRFTTTTTLFFHFDKQMYGMRLYNWHSRLLVVIQFIHSFESTAMRNWFFHD